MLGVRLEPRHLHNSCKPLKISGFFYFLTNEKYQIRLNPNCYILKIGNTPKRWTMEVEFRSTAEDYRGFYRYYTFRRNLGMKIAVIGLFSFWVGSGFVGRPFSWPLYFLDSLAVGLILLLCATGIPYIIVLVKTRKRLKQLERTALRRRIELTGDGLLVQMVPDAGPEQEKNFWRWGAVKYAGGSSKFVFIVLIRGGVYVIPKSSFHSTGEADHFVFILEAGMEKVWGSKPKRAKRLYLWGLLGFIPNVGVISGLILLFKGIFQFRDRILVIIGASDILFTFVFWWIVTSVSFHSTAFKTLEKEMARTELNTIFRYVEFYKTEHGVYPDSLEQMDLKKNNVWINDPVQSCGPKHKTINFFYRKVGEKYWLFSVGPDGKPFTRDDIFPVMNPADSGKFGLMRPR
jgi:hypothetical protein